MKEATWLIAAVLALGLGAVAAHEDDTLQGEELQQQAQHSRDFAARKVCQGQAFEWQGDVLVCFKEQP